MNMWSCAFEKNGGQVAKRNWPQKSQNKLRGWV